MLRNSTIVGVFVALLAAPSRVAAQKDAFVDSFIAFHAALSGSYGDEGQTAAAALERMAASLTAWEESQATTEAALKARAGITPGELALFYAEQARFDEAIREMSAAIAAERPRAALYVFKGLLQETAGHSSDAADTFALASSTDPTDPIAAYLAASHIPATAAPEERERRAAVLMNAVARTAAPQRSPFIQYELVNDAASRVPAFSPAAYEDGFALFVQGRFDDAVTRFKAALAEDPLVVDAAGRNAQVIAGVAALRAKRGADAIKQLQGAIVALPKSSEAHRLLGVTLRALARLPESIRSFENAVRLAPRDERARVTLGATLTEAGRLAEAERILRQTVEMLPKSGEARWALATVYERQNRGLDAIATLEEAAALTVVAGKAALYWRIAELAHRHQDYDRVVAALTLRAWLQRNDAAAHKALGIAQMRVGRNNDAMAELLLATLLGMEDPETLTAIGQIHLGADRFEAAESVLRKAVAQDPRNSQARYALGMTLTRLGRTDEAKVQLDEFKKLRSAALEEQQRQFEEKPAGTLP
jgi:tetratricopeptide (TPR) repeat protein